jgi:hypothetical protein
MPLPKPIIFDASETNMVEPSNAVLSDGFADGDRPPAGWINWLFNRSGQWGEATRLLIQSRILNWKEQAPAINANFVQFHDSKVLSNGQEVHVMQDFDGANGPDAGEDVLRLIIGNHGDFGASDQVNDVNVAIKPNVLAGRNYHPWIADDGTTAALIAPNPGGTLRSLRYSALPITTASTWSAASISGASDRDVLAVHYSTVHSLWVIVVEKTTDYQIYTATTPSGTWTLRQTLGANPSGAFIAENLDGVFVIQIKIGANTHEYWRSTNGTTWTSVTDFGISGNAQELFYDSHNNLFWSHQGSNLYYSTSGSSGTWTLAGNFLGGVWAVTSMACDQYGTIVASGTSTQVDKGVGLWYSQDAGDTWTELYLNSAIDPVADKGFYLAFNGHRFVQGVYFDSGSFDSRLWSTPSLLDLTALVGTDGSGISNSGAPNDARYVLGAADAGLANGEVYNSDHFDGSAGGTFNLRQPESRFFYVDHMGNNSTGTFLGVPGGVTNISSGSMTQIRVTDRPGCIQFSTTTSSNGQAGWVSNSAKENLGGGIKWRIRWHFRIDSSLSDGTNRYRISCGFAATNTFSANNAAFSGIEYKDDINSGKLQLKQQTATASQTVSNTNVTVAINTDYEIVMEWSSSTGALSLCTINGSSVTLPAATNIPTNTDVLFGFSIDKDVGTTARTFYSDYFSIEAIY